jgi:hypothetical protein
MLLLSRALRNPEEVDDLCRTVPNANNTSGISNFLLTTHTNFDSQKMLHVLYAACGSLGFKIETMHPNKNLNLSMVDLFSSSNLHSSTFNHTTCMTKELHFTI